MITSKAIRYSIFITCILALASFSSFLVKGAPIQLLYYDFYIAPSQPDLISKNTYVLNDVNQYVLGIPESEAIGKTSTSNTYYFEIWSSARVHIYFLDSTGFSSQYTDYISDFIGDNPPSSYTLFYICDGYLKVEFATSISPKLILFSEGVEVNGNYIWTEGMNYIKYKPHHIQLKESDRPTNDCIQIYNANASISVYVLDDDQYSFYKLQPNTPPSIFSNIAYERNFFATNLTFTAEAGEIYHIIIWHEAFHGGVSGTIRYDYEYNPSFFGKYWSLLLVIVVLIISILFIVYRKHTLPPVIWTMEKVKYYLLQVPWRTIRTYFSEIREEVNGISDRLRGISVEDEVAEKEISPYKKLIVSIASLIFPLNLHRFIVVKIGTGIFSILINLVAVVFFVQGIINIREHIQYLIEKAINESAIKPDSLGSGIMFVLIAFVIMSLYFIDILAVFLGTFTDRKQRKVIKW